MKQITRDDGTAGGNQETPFPRLGFVTETDGFPKTEGRRVCVGGWERDFGGETGRTPHGLLAPNDFGRFLVVDVDLDHRPCPQEQSRHGGW